MNPHHPKLPSEQLGRALELRQTATTPERLLWSRLRGKQVHGVRFRRQHPLGLFFVDFYCHAASLVVEVDGESHVGRVRRDAERERYLRERGLRVIRFTNDQVIHNLDTVVEAIAGAAAGSPHPSPSPSQGEGGKKPSPSPSQGEGGKKPFPSPSQGEGGKKPSPSPSQGEGGKSLDPPPSGRGRGRVGGFGPSASSSSFSNSPSPSPNPSQGEGGKAS